MILSPVPLYGAKAAAVLPGLAQRCAQAAKELPPEPAR